MFKVFAAPFSILPFYPQDYAAFDEAVENKALKEFLKI